MKLKFWQGEFEFDRSDAVIVIPVILLLLSFATPLPKVWLLVGFAAYFAVLFFGGKFVEPVKWWLKRRQFRCPYCKSLYTVHTFMDNYLGDNPYQFYRCNDCGKSSVFIDNRLQESTKWKLTSGK